VITDRCACKDELCINCLLLLESRPVHGWIKMDQVERFELSSYTLVLFRGPVLSGLYKDIMVDWTCFLFTDY
jgi:hypothetical protein